jgi:hypothetical protein
MGFVTPPTATRRRITAMFLEVTNRSLLLPKLIRRKNGRRGATST